MPVDDRAIETNEAQSKRQTPLRRDPRLRAGAEPLMLLVRILARRAAGDVHRNSATGTMPTIADPPL